MATASDGPVTIDRVYFETLLRRANFNHDEFAAASAAIADSENPLTVVPKVDYENLLLIARQFANLRTNLINGGVTEDMMALLTQDAASAQRQQLSAQSMSFPTYKEDDHDEGGVRLKPQAQLHAAVNSDTRPSMINGYGQGNSRYAGGNVFNKQPEWANGDPDGDDHSALFSTDGHTPELPRNPVYHFDPKQPSERVQYARMCKRTIVLAGLADGTTHDDVTKVIRGGLVLEVYLKAAEHSVLVSFLREEDAMRFYEHSRKHDLYIKHKRVFIRWADRHFHLPGHVAGKIGLGATRNLIIRRCDPDHTEDGVRDDLEHIHNLIVIKVEFIGGSCYIKTNSVHNAMFARTCMMSRVKYKGSKIEWDLDECEQPLEIAQKPSLPQRGASTKKPVVKVRNRFATLRLDDDDDESDDKFDSSSEFPAVSTVDVGA
ncbi:hypothetical protein BJ170DRAFT_683747 [Xylariales sp. AK1849]|nr:hypothetical protein BJ170DRAFT_683747 [Xylariales sp. AK1849]